MDIISAQGRPCAYVLVGDIYVRFFNGCHCTIWFLATIEGPQFWLRQKLTMPLAGMVYSPAAHGGRLLPMGWTYWPKSYYNLRYMETKIQAPRSIGCSRRACHIQKDGRKEGRKEGKLGNILWFLGSISLSSSSTKIRCIDQRKFLPWWTMKINGKMLQHWLDSSHKIVQLWAKTDVFLLSYHLAKPYCFAKAL